MIWLVLLSTAAIIQVVYWLMLDWGLARSKTLSQQLSTVKTTEKPPISVIIPARNEEENLPALLDALSQQSHSQFEVVLVNDGSTDRTRSIMQEWVDVFDHIQVLDITEPQEPRKKHALTQGIQAASHELLAFTDADCRPDADWLTSLVDLHAASSTPSLIIGYSPYRPDSGFLNRLARYETFVTGIYTAATVGLNRAYMAVGRNLSYPKTLFYDLDGFSHSLDSLSGDDDLFVQHAVDSNVPIRVTHAFGRDSLVHTSAPSSWGEWLRQKRRHASAGRFYKPHVQFHLTLFHLTDLAVWLAPVFLGWTGAILLAIKLAFQLQTLYSGADLLHEKPLLPWSPLLAPCYTLYISVIEPLSLLRLPKQWS